MARNLAQHLAEGYDYVIRGVRGRGKWTPADLAEDLKADSAFSIEAGHKLQDLQAVIDAGRTCDVSKVQHRILSEGFRALQKA